MYFCSNPPPDLAGHVRLLWGVTAERSELRSHELIVPDGCCELVVHVGRPYLSVKGDGHAPQPTALVHGQLQRSMTLVCDSAMDFVAVRFEPAGIATLFGVPAAELREAAVPLLDLFGASGAELSERICEVPDVSSRWRLMVDFMRHHRRSNPAARADLTRHIAARLQQQRFPANELAEEVGRSWRSVERDFKSLVGLTPRHFMRLQRVSRAAKALQLPNRPNLVGLAADCGFSDQAHFTREFSDLIGISPSKFARAVASEPPSIIFSNERTISI